MFPDLTYIGCEYCHSFIIHPVDRYQPGCHNYSPHATLSISGRDEDPWEGPNLDMEIVKDDKDSEDKTPATTPIYKQEDSSEGYNKTPDSPRKPASPPYELEGVTGSGQLHEGSREDHIINSNIALEYYNQRNKTNFKLVEDEAMDSNYFVEDCLIYVHCFFNATDSSMKQFFAEIRNGGPLQPVVNTCEILEGKCYIGCDFCRLFIHPVGGYVAGDPNYLPDYEDDPDKEFVEKDEDYDYDYETPEPDSPPFDPDSPPYYEPDTPPYEQASSGY